MNFKLKLPLITLLLVIFNLYAQEIKIEMENTYVNLGEWTTFEVTASGDIKDIKLTEPKDLELTQIGNTSYLNSINGKTTRTYSLTYKIKTLKEGAVDLPIFLLTTNSGNEIKSNKVTIYSTKLEDDIIQKHNTQLEFETPYVKLYIDLPNRNLYVGEAIPVDVVAYFSPNFQPGIERDPYIKTGSFILETVQKIQK